MAETIDALVATLINMGFEFDDCQEAIKSGKMSVTSAVEWILAGKPSEHPMVAGSPGQPVLNLKKNRRVQASPSTSSAFNSPLPIPDHSHMGASDLNRSSTTYNKSGQTETEEKSKSPEVHSRYAATRDERERFLEKKRQKFADDVKSYKAMEKKAKNLVLQEIKADREARRSKSSSAKPVCYQSASKSSTAEEDSAQINKKKESQSMIQFRFPSGTTVRKSFSNEAVLRKLNEFVISVEESLQGKNITFIQPFPRRVFDPSISFDSIEQLGLTPSANLVVQISATQEQLKPQEQHSMPMVPQDQPVVPPVNVGRPGLMNDPNDIPVELRRAIGVNDPSDVANLVVNPPPGQQYSFASNPISQAEWPAGAGRRLLEEDENDPNDEEVDPRMELDPQAEEQEANQHLSNQLRAFASSSHGSNASAPFSSPIGSVPQSQQSHPWGSGRTLEESSNPAEQFAGDEQEEGQDDIISRPPEMEIVPREQEIFHPRLGLGARLGSSDEFNRHQQMSPTARRALVAEVHEARHNQIIDEEAGGQVTHDPKSGPSAEQSTLIEMCMQVVMSRIGAEGRMSLSSFGNLPPQLAHRFFQHLVKCKKLSSTTVHLFRSSPISKVNLDYYIYATNQLVKSLQILSNIQHLSLRGSNLLNDAGLQAISSFARLKSLNLEGSTQFTDRGLDYLQGLSNLSSFVLNETRVTDAGMIRYLKNRSNPEALARLSLTDVANVTDLTLQGLSAVKNLRILSVAYTKITRIDLITQHLLLLQELNIAGCSVSHEQLAHLSDLSHTLRSLNIVNIITDGSEDGNAVLYALRGMHHLQNLAMRFHASLTHAGIGHLGSCPITSLNLSNHTLIDDQAMTHIANMHCLRHLNLSNTRITDASLPRLAVIFERLVELQLQHTNISSAGLVTFFEACTGPALELTSLNLAFTGIGNRAFYRGFITSYCPSLVELNLSNTKVSDSGLRRLALSSLSRLLLEGSMVRRYVDSALYTECPSLVHVRADSTRSPIQGPVESDAES